MFEQEAPAQHQKDADNVLPVTLQSHCQALCTDVDQSRRR